MPFAGPQIGGMKSAPRLMGSRPFISSLRYFCSCSSLFFMAALLKASFDFHYTKGLTRFKEHIVLVASFFGKHPLITLPSSRYCKKKERTRRIESFLMTVFRSVS